MTTLLHTDFNFQVVLNNSPLQNTSSRNLVCPCYQSSYYCKTHDLLFVGCQFSQFAIFRASKLELMRIVKIDESKYGSAIGTNIEAFDYCETNDIIFVYSEKGIYGYSVENFSARLVFQKNWFGFSINSCYMLSEKDSFFVCLRRGLEGIVEQRQISMNVKNKRKKENLLINFPTKVGNSDCISFVSDKGKLCVLNLAKFQNTRQHNLNFSIDDKIIFVKFIHKSSMMICITQKGTVFMFSLTGRHIKLIKKFTFPTEHNRLFPIAVFERCNLLVRSSDQKCYVCINAAKGKVVKILNDLVENFSSIQVIEENRTILLIDNNLKICKYCY